MFSDRRLAAAELRAALPAAASVRIDWDTLTAAPGQFTDAVFCQRHSDLVFHARCSGQNNDPDDTDSEALLWIVTEHQSRQDRWMALRIVDILPMMWRQWRHLNERALTLPAILPVVVYNDPEPWRAATDISELLALSPDALAALRPHLLRGGFVLDDLTTIAEDDIKARHLDAFARLAMFTLARAATADFLSRLTTSWKSEMRIIIDAQSERITELLVYIHCVNKQADVASLRQVIATVTEDEERAREIMTPTQYLMHRYREEGRVEGRVEGRAEGRAMLQHLATRMLSQQFGPLPHTIIERLECADSDALQRITERIPGARHLEDVFSE